MRTYIYRSSIVVLSNNNRSKRDGSRLANSAWQRAFYYISSVLILQYTTIYRCAGGKKKGPFAVLPTLLGRGYEKNHCSSSSSGVSICTFVPVSKYFCTSKAREHLRLPALVSPALAPPVSAYIAGV
jgi:hypothetical protein